MPSSKVKGLLESFVLYQSEDDSGYEIKAVLVPRLICKDGLFYLISQKSGALHFPRAPQDKPLNPLARAFQSIPNFRFLTDSGEPLAPTNVELVLNGSIWDLAHSEGLESFRGLAIASPTELTFFYELEIDFSDRLSQSLVCQLDSMDLYPLPKAMCHEKVFIGEDAQIAKYLHTKASTAVQPHE